MEINWLHETLDTAISLLGKYGRWLNAKAKKNCFIVWTAVQYIGQLEISI